MAPASTTASTTRSGAELLGHAARDRLHRAGIVHQLAEQRAEQEDRKELRHELRRASHEGLRPVREQRLAREHRGDQRRSRRQQQHAPAAIGEGDQKAERDQNAEKSHASHLLEQHDRCRRSNACRCRRHSPAGIRPPPCGPRRAAWRGIPTRHSASRNTPSVPMISLRTRCTRICAQRAPSLSPESATWRSSAIMRSSFSSTALNETSFSRLRMSRALISACRGVRAD